MPSDRTKEVLQYVGANVRRWRLRRELTQERLAEVAELDLRFLQRVERGTTNLSVAVLVAVADALEVPPGSLLKPAKLEPPLRGRPRKAAGAAAAPRRRE